MGLLIEGKWHTDWYDTKSTGGKFQRTASGFRNWITKDGSPGLTGKGGFKAEPDRYHLYVSLACPWAHRALIFRKLKGLEELITISSVNSFMGDQGWTFEPGNGVIADNVNHKSRLHEIYPKTSENNQLHKNHKFEFSDFCDHFIREPRCEGGELSPFWDNFENLKKNISSRSFLRS